jgi:hypothetical protein
VNLADLLLSMKGSIDGVSILTNDETASVAKQLISELRLPVSEVPLPSPTPTPAQGDSGEAALATETPAMRRTPLTTPQPSETATTTTGRNSARSLLLLVGLSIMGILISGVVATVLIYSFRTSRKRR